MMVVIVVWLTLTKTAVQNAGAMHEKLALWEIILLQLEMAVVTSKTIIKNVCMMDLIVVCFGSYRQPKKDTPICLCMI